MKLNVAHMTGELKILIVEDNQDDVYLIERELVKAGFVFSSLMVSTKKDYEEALHQFKPDVILSDHSLPDFNSVEALKIYKRVRKELRLTAPFILITGSVSEEFAVDCIKEGAADYILKDRLIRLPSSITAALENLKAKQEKKKFEEEQKRLLEIIRRSVNEIYIFNADTLLFEYVNEGALKNLGYQQEEVLQMTPLELIPSFTTRLFKDIINAVERSDLRKTIFEASHKRKDGTLYPVEVHLQLIEHGSKKSFLAVGIDISQRKAAEIEKDMVKAVSEIFSSDDSLEDDLQLTLETICRQYKVTAAEAWVASMDAMYLKKAASYRENGQLNYSDTKDFFLQGEGLVGNAWKTKQQVFIEDIQKDQLYIRKEFADRNTLCSVLAVPVIFKNEVTAVLTFYSTKHKKKVQDLVVLGNNLLTQLASDIRRKKIESELNNFFQLSPDILCICGTDGYIKKINPAIRASLGYEVEEVFGQPFMNFVHPDDLELTMREIMRVRKENDPIYMENRIVAKDGNIRWIAWTISTIISQSLVYVVGKDISEKKVAEKELHLLNEKLNTTRLRKQKEITEAVISAQEEERQEIGRELHDNINQVLTSALLYLNMCKTDPDKNEAFLSKSNELVRLAINEIRNLSHSLIAPSLAETDFNKMLYNLIEMLELTEGLAVSHRIEINDEAGLSDKVKLVIYRIVQEQLQNIMKHAKAKHVSISVIQDEERIALEIVDDGVGFNPSESRKGIGFLNMQSRASAFSGEMRVISAPGKGCKLEVAIPLSAASLVV